MSGSAGTIYLEDALKEFRKTKRAVEKALAQVSDAEYFATPDAETNSIAINVKHMAGNMRSRWRDFLTSDGEKPDRFRDTEFVIDSADTREDLTARWEAGWQFVFGAIEPLTDADLTRTVLIRGEPHAVVQAINRQLTHYSYHAGQIILLAKHFKVGEWKTLSVPRGASDALNAEMAKKWTKT